MAQRQDYFRLDPLDFLPEPPFASLFMFLLGFSGAFYRECVVGLLNPGLTKKRFEMNACSMNKTLSQQFFFFSWLFSHNHK